MTHDSLRSGFAKKTSSSTSLSFQPSPTLLPSSRRTSLCVSFSEFFL